MSSLVVFAFNNEDGADRIITDVQPLQQQGYITILDAATVMRKRDGTLKIRQVNLLVGSGVLGVRSGEC